MSHLVIGVDPGLTGAIAFLSEHSIVVDDMPVSAKIGSRSGNEICPHTLGLLLRQALVEVDPRSTVAYIEKVSARPGQGVSSMFAFGEGLGIVKGVLATLDIPYEFVTPVSWKRSFGLLGSEKDAARTKAIQLYPHVANRLARKKDIGRADALLIASYGKSKLH